MLPPTAASLLFVSGLKREAANLAGPDRISICGDASILRAKLSQLADLRLRLVISWGICGGLDPRLRPGDLVVGTEVVSDAGSIRADETVMLSLERHLANAGERVVIGRLAAAHAPVLTTRAKAELHTATGAVAVDMESMLVGRFAFERGVPFAILRAVSDPADRGLPPLVMKAVEADGRVNIAAVILSLIRSPGQLPDMIAAARDSKAALRALGRCRGFPSLFLGLGLTHI
jgi:adenosylhomocysteine nucleosidase